jgi:hypothetical protein
MAEKPLEIAKYNTQEQYAYQDSLKYYRDLKNVMNTAIEEAIIEVAKKGILKDYDDNAISELTNLSVEQIQHLRAKLKKNNDS